MFNFEAIQNSVITNKRIQTEDIKVLKNNTIRLGDPLVKLLALSSISQEIVNEEGETETLIAYDRVSIADTPQGVWVWKSEATIVDGVDVTPGVKLNAHNKFSSQTVAYSLKGDGAVWKNVKAHTFDNGTVAYLLEQQSTVENVEELPMEEPQSDSNESAE